MLALVGTVTSRVATGNVLLRDGDGVLGTHTLEFIDDAAHASDCPVR